MSRSIWLPFTLLSILAQLGCFAWQNSTASVQAPDAAARARAEIQRIEDALPRILDRGAALYLLAERYARLGEFPRALSLLKECISQDEGFDPTDSPAFQPLKAYPEFRELAEQVRRRYPPAHRARVAFTVPEKDLFPEGLAVDSDRRVFYMGSMRHKKIVMITWAGAVSDFVRPDLYNLMEMGGIKVDPTDHSVWAATGPDAGYSSELVHFDAHGKLLERFPAGSAEPHIFNDLVLRNSQEIYLTDTLANHVYNFGRKSHSFMPLTFPRPLFRPNGIALSDAGNSLYVADAFGVILVNLMDDTAHEVNPGRGATLAGIDGLYWYKGGLLAVQYGAGSHRVARFRLSSDGLQVTSTEILEYRTPLASFPTTGAVAGENFYFIANTGIGNLKDNKIVDPKKLKPVHIAVVPLDQ